MLTSNNNFLSFKQTQEELFAKAGNSSGVALGGFFQIEFANEKTQEHTPSQRQTDCSHCWKFHVSVAREELEQAWNVLTPVFLQHQNKLHTLKITQGEHRPGSRVREGAQITIYIPNSDNHPDGFLFYDQLAEQISVTLNIAGIAPGKAPNSDAALNGYVSVRHEDTDRYGNYDPSLTINQRNPFNEAIFTYQSTIYENLINGLDKGIEILNEKRQLLAPSDTVSPQRAQRVKVLDETMCELVQVKEALGVQSTNKAINNSTVMNISNKISEIFNSAQKKVTTHFSFKETLNRALGAIMEVFGIRAKNFFSPCTKQIVRDTIKETSAVMLEHTMKVTR